MLVKFLCYCCGARWEVLEKCPSQKPLYASVGATILFTALLASISGGYALYFIFSKSEFSWLYAIVFGIIWGLTIFNLDRLIILSIRKSETPNMKREFWQAAPRLILAVFISLVIAKPLEMKIFEDQIQRQIKLDAFNAKLSDKHLVDSLYKEEKRVLVTERNLLQKRIDSLRSLKTVNPNTIAFQDLDAQLLKATEERDRVFNTNSGPIQANNRGWRNLLSASGERFIRDMPDSTSALNRKRQDALKFFREEKKLLNQNEVASQVVEQADSAVIAYKETYYAEVNDELAILGQDLEEVLNSLKKLEEDETLDDDKLAEGQRSAFTKDFLSQLRSLGTLTDSWFSTMWWANLIITLLFIALETAPVIAKLLLKRTAYDELLEQEEQKEKWDTTSSNNMDYEVNKEKNQALQTEKIETLKQAVSNWSVNQWQNEASSIRSEQELKLFIDRILNYDNPGQQEPRDPRKDKLLIRWLAAGVLVLLLFNGVFLINAQMNSGVNEVQTKETNGVSEASEQVQNAVTEEPEEELKEEPALASGDFQEGAGDSDPIIVPNEVSNIQNKPAPTTPSPVALAKNEPKQKVEEIPQETSNVNVAIDPPETLKSLAPELVKKDLNVDDDAIPLIIDVPEANQMATDSKSDPSVRAVRTFVIDQLSMLFSDPRSKSPMDTISVGESCVLLEKGDKTLKNKLTKEKGLWHKVKVNNLEGWVFAENGHFE